MAQPVRQALVGVGTNLGDREATVRWTLGQLQAHPAIASVVTSPLYETDPIGLTDQPRFLNLVLGLETTLTPEALLAVLQELETAAGRVREVRWGPRTLDLDLLAFEGETRASPALQLPHPRMLERGFVTIPLGDLLALPRFQRPAWAELHRQLAALPDNSEGVRRWPSPRHG
jgi:2-amino-4-hydroxy-6-hydroxymethyldihydropteridine diphosphokinase